jgi:hypothetical protein
MKKCEKNRASRSAIFFFLHCRLCSRVAREAAKLAAEFAAKRRRDDSVLPHADRPISDCRAVGRN